MTLHRSTRAARPSPYRSAAETSALLHASLDSRLRRLDQADMMTTDEAAALLGTSRVTVNAWISKGRCIGLTQTKRGFKIPRWQFEPAIWDHLPGIGQALGLHEGWALLNFFETPHGGLEGHTPRQALEQGQAERVLAKALSIANLRTRCLVRRSACCAEWKAPRWSIAPQADCTACCLTWPVARRWSLSPDRPPR